MSEHPPKSEPGIVFVSPEEEEEVQATEHLPKTWTPEAVQQCLPLLDEYKKVMAQRHQKMREQQISDANASQQELIAWIRMIAEEFPNQYVLDLFFGIFPLLAVAYVDPAVLSESQISIDKLPNLLQAQSISPKEFVLLITRFLQEMKTQKI